MNPFFSPTPEYLPDLPERAYARIEEIEPSDEDDRNERLLVFSAASADWIDENGENLYKLHDPEKCSSAWAEYWSRLFAASRGDGEIPSDAYRGLPLFRYEISLSPKDEETYEEYLGFVQEDSWVLIERNSQSKTIAEVYRNIFQPGEELRISAQRVDDERISRSLTAMFDMTHWPDSDKSDIERVLVAASREASYFAAYDVGQGAATALLANDQRPFLYYDLGAGITRNAHTTPPDLRFCFSFDPPVIVSHWDMDHWAGANKDSRAKKQTWIAPRQSIRPAHVTFGNEVLHAGGSLLIWPAGCGPITVALGAGQRLLIDQCTSTRKNDRNGSGLAIRVDDTNHGELRHWVGTGDAGYQDLPFSMSGNVTALMVPHHGAKMRKNRGAVPPKTGRHYARLIYSFGPGNAHGKTAVRHPTLESVREHEHEGWDTAHWSGDPTPGSRSPNGDLLATAVHTTTNAGGVIVGWDSCSPKMGTPCGSTGGCTTAVKQT